MLVPPFVPPFPTNPSEFLTKYIFYFGIYRAKIDQANMVNLVQDRFNVAISIVIYSDALIRALVGVRMPSEKVS